MMTLQMYKLRAAFFLLLCLFCLTQTNLFACQAEHEWIIEIAQRNENGKYERVLENRFNGGIARKLNDIEKENKEKHNKIIYPGFKLREPDRLFLKSSYLAIKISYKRESCETILLLFSKEGVKVIVEDLFIYGGYFVVKEGFGFTAPNQLDKLNKSAIADSGNKLSIFHGGKSYSMMSKGESKISKGFMNMTIYSPIEPLACPVLDIGSKKYYFPEVFIANNRLEF